LRDKAPKPEPLISHVIIRSCVTALICCISLHVYCQQSPSYGPFFKVAVEKPGVYKISRDHIKKMGFDPSKIDPAGIRIYGSAGGMLPQANNQSIPDNFQQLAIYVSGQDDGKFDKNDFILFYADGPDAAQFDLSKNLFSYSNNLYSDKNFYFFTVADDKTGKRITDTENLTGTFPLITTFDDYFYHEVDETNILQSGREWYGEPFGLTTELPLKFDVAGIVPNSEIHIVSSVLGQSYADASFRLNMNGTDVGEQPILPIVSATYSSKGYARRDTIVISESGVGAASRSEQQFTYTFNKASGYSQGYLDFLLLSFKRNLSLYGDQTIFTSAESFSNNTSTFQLSSSDESLMIWDITEHNNVKNQVYSTNSGIASFSTQTNQLKKYIAFNSNAPAPEFIGEVEPPYLHTLATPNFVIVTNPLFKSEAQRLADHRSNYSNISTLVVTTDQIYNEFSSGRQDVSAIRNFMRMLYNSNPSALKSLLLFGKGTFDYKNKFADNTNFVATYESRNSIHPLQTYSSDDFFGFLEESEGSWNESPAQNHTLDIGVGRLPVTTPAQAKSVVDKIIQYDTDSKNAGYWRKEIVFVADDGSNSDGWTSLHQVQADNLASLAESLETGIDTKKLFMGTYHKTLSAGAEAVPQMADDIERAFQNGALIINYTGHGSEKIWADESVFSPTNIDHLENHLYPFLVTATCEFGRQDDPFQTSSAELCVIKPNGGAIGMVTTARPVNSTTNFDLNQAFYNALFTRSEGYPDMGEVFRRTKNNSISGVSNRNFSLLGDPTLKLAIPEDVIHVTSVKTENGSDTLKALSKVVVQGQIENFAGEKLSQYTGILEAALFDKETDFVTIGRNKPAFNYKEWHNILFRGQATIADGAFQFEFILPKNISYAIAEGKLSLYASDSSANRDAKGFSRDFKIGGSEQNPVADNTPPQIDLFIGDESFVNGGVATSDSWLIGKLHDDSGINISDYGIGNSLIAILDNDVETFVLNEYYIADADDYSSGTIRFPLKGLSPGKHTITVKAWDVYNNPAEGRVDFVVTEGQALVIESFGTYPNPSHDNTTFFFTQNRSGDDLEAHLFIYTATGNLMNAVQIPVLQSEYHTDLIELADLIKTPNQGAQSEKLPAGIYFAKLVVRSLANGSKNEQVTKLIILN
jgi:hypothetical protein